MENLELGLLLIMVGMTSVFAILLLIIWFSKGLIGLVNRYAPEEFVEKTRRPTTVTPMGNGEVASQTTAAIVSAVSVLTAGAGRVTKIE
ncbi:MAG: OadG family protein [Tannerella sp.]|jgi:oxaloacetate decarboxylase gamma subunit|nr:OadG family protein [Tannerella sp.]